MGDRAEYLLFRSSGEQLWLTLHMASHRIKVHLPTWPAENTLHFTFLLAIALLTPRQLPSPDSCASGLFPSNYFHCHTGSTFFYCEGECRLRQLTCHIIEHLVKRPNFPKGEFQLYQLTHKSYLETYGWLRKNWSSSRPGLLGSQSTGDISRKTSLVLVEGSLSSNAKGGWIGREKGWQWGAGKAEPRKKQNLELQNNLQNKTKTPDIVLSYFELCVLIYPLFIFLSWK